MDPRQTPEPQQQPSQPNWPQPDPQPQAQPEPFDAQPAPSQPTEPPFAPSAEPSSQPQNVVNPAQSSYVESSQDLQTSGQPQSSLPTSAPDKKSKKPLILALVIALVLLLAGGAVAAFALMQDDENESSAGNENRQSAVTPKPTEVATVDASTTPLNGKVITDPEMGYTLTAKTLSIGAVEIPAQFAKTNSGKTVVAVEMSNVDTNKFAGSAKNVVLSLVDSKGVKYTESSLSDADLTAKGMNPLSKATEANDTVTGWVAFWIPSEETEALTLRYKRLAATVVGTSQTIPAKEFDLSLK